MLRKMLALGILSIACFAQAQQTPPATIPQTTPTISPDIKKLDWMIGAWAGDFTWSGPGIQGTGPYTTVITRDGQFLKFNCSITVGNAPFTETSYLGFDPKSKKYVMYTFSSMSPLPRVDRGTWTADTTWVSISDPWDMGNGTPTTSRSTVTKKSNDEVTLVIEVNNNGQWTKVGEGNLRRKA